MLEKLNSLSPRAKSIAIAAILVLTPPAAWAGYNLGYHLGAS